MDEEIPYNELLLDVEDSIVVGLYHYLWLKDGKGRACPEVNIPHTVIISNGRPKTWYFTSGKEHCIKRKNRANITNANITDALAPRPKLSSTSTLNTNRANTRNNNFASNRATTVAYGGGNNSSSGGGTADPSAALLGAWGAPSNPPTTQQQQLQLQQQQSQAGHRRNKSADAAAAAAAFADGGRAPDGTCTGTTLGPWPHHGVVARFQGSMTNPHNAGVTSNRGASLGRKKKGFELQDESVEFFTREQLAEILPPGHAVVHGVAALHDGVLQRFVQPRGHHHFSIRATWSPNACVVERRTCKAKLNDPRVALAERLAAWDGPNWLSEHTLITGTVMYGSICRLCDNVASHLAEVSGGAVRVLRMVLFFCVDEANRIWLTHCGTLKTERLREHAMHGGGGRFGGGGGGPMMGFPSRLRGGFAAGLVPTTSAGLRLRSPDGSAGGAAAAAALSGETSLDLPAPSAAFMASKTAAAAAAAADGGGDASGGGRFLCVLTGEMYPAATERYDVTYKQLLQHWFSLASQLPNEGDRLRAMDTIPLAIRRANPSLTREWYLRVRSQPTFLYRTAPVCVEAAAQITGMALEDLQRALQPTPSGMMGVMAAAAAAVGGSGATGGTAWPPAGSPGAAAAAGGGGGGGGGGGISNSGMGILAGWAAAGAAVQTHGSPPVTARGPVAEGLSRQATANTSLRVQLAASGSVRRPSTALPPAGPSSHSLLQQPQTTPFRSGSRQQLPSAAHQHSPNSQPGAGPSRRFMPRSKSASPSVASSRLSAVAHNNGGGGGGGGGGGLPSMLVPRAENEKSAGSGLGRVPSFLQVYGPTPEQAAEAAAIAAALPYEVLDEARQLAGAEDAAAAAAAETEGVETEGEEATSPRGGHRRLQGDAAADADGGGGGGGCDLSDGSATAADGSRTTSQGDAAGCTLAAPAGSPNEPRNAVNATTAAATTSGGGSRAAAAGLGGSPGLGYATAAVTAANGGGGGSGYSPPRPGRLPGRMSASSEITEMGSIASFSDPSSPSVNHASYNHLHGHGHGHAYSHTYLHPPPPLASSGGGGGGGGGSAAAVGSPGSIGASRMSPPRSAGAPTLHTIHEEGAAAVLPPPPSASSRRSGSPLVGGTELLFPPPSRGGSGSHSVPRMRPPARPGMDRQLAAGSSGGAGRRHPGPPPTYGHSGGGAAATAGGGLQRGNSLSESGDLPVLPGTAAAAAAAASLNSTMASSIGSLSRRSTSNQAVLSTEDIRTLRELSEAYTAAERLTQQLLAQAHEILSEDGGSRPGSTGTSPMHGARQGRTAPSPRALTPTSRPGTGNSGFSGTRQPSVSSTGTGTGTGGGGGGSRLMRLSSGSGRPGTTGTQRPSSSSLPTAQPPPASATGPTTAGVEPYVNRTGSGRSVGSGSGGAGDAATPPATALAAASLVSAPGQAISPGADLIMGLGRSSPGTGDGGDGGVVAAAAAAAARHSPGDLDLFTSAEADLLAEALQE